MEYTKTEPMERRLSLALRSHLLARYAVLTAGCLVYAISFNWCYAPNHIPYGGFTGIAQIARVFVPGLPIGTLVFALNLPLFLLGWKLLGGAMLASSLYAMALSSALIDLLEQLHTFQPMDPLLACIYGGVLLGLGLGLIIGQNATTGGTDLLARLLKLPLPWLPMGRLILLLDLAIICATALVFRRMDAALYGLVALYIASTVMDRVLYGPGTAKVAYIITQHSDAVQRALTHTLERGVTRLYGRGGWSGEEKAVLMCAFRQRQIAAVKQAVKQLDPNAFLIVCDAHEVLGKGFRTYQKHDI